MINSLTYMIGAAVVGILHMSAPDHWLTLCVLAQNKRWATKKLFGISLVTAFGHVALSIGMGLAVVVVGMLLSNLVAHYLDVVIGIIMISVGFAVGIVSLLKKKEHKHAHDHTHNHDNLDDTKESSGKLAQKMGYFAILGAALSPDPSIIPIYLSAISSGFYFALELSVVFAAASILTLLFLVQLGKIGLAKTFARLPEKYHDAMVGFVIFGIGVYILVSGYVG